MNRHFAIAGVQTSNIPGNTQQNIQKMESYIENVCGAFPWVDMICFSEFSIPGFHPLTWKEQAETIPGATTDRFCETAKAMKKWLLIGSMFEKEADKTYNTAVVISPEGQIAAKYRKMLPWAPLEPSTPGDKFCVFDIPGIGKFGLCICYDAWFPEIARTLAWMGAEVILHPAMTPSSAGPLESAINKANAIFNQCYVVSIGGSGVHGALTLAGRSMVVDPEGRVLQEMGETESLMIEILDLDQVTKARTRGTIGLGPFLKHLKMFNPQFPIYKDLANGEVYKNI